MGTMDMTTVSLLLKTQAKVMAIQILVQYGILWEAWKQSVVINREWDANL